MADTLEILVALKTNEAINAFNGMVNHFQSGNPLAKIGSTMTTGVTVPIVAGMGLATSEAIKFNSAINNSTRTLNLTKAEAANLSKEVLTLAPSLGLLPTEFANVAAEAGKLGVAKDEVAQFGKTIANLSTITDVPIGEFTQKAGAIKTIFAQNNAEFEKFGAAVNSLDDNIGGTTPNILEFTSRVGAVGKQIGLTAGETAAFGAVFEKVGIAPERAGTAFQNFAGKLFTIDSATPKAKAAFESMGYSAATFGQTMAANPTQAISEFLTRLNSIQDPVQKSQLLIEIFGKSSSAEIAALATQSGLLGQAFKVAGDDTANMAKMVNEVGLKMQDPAVQMKVLQAQVTAIGIQLGSVLVPILSAVLTAITPLTTALSQFLAQNPQWAQFFVIAAGGLAVLGPLVSIISTLGTAFTMLTTAITFVVTGFTSLGTILATVGGVFGTIGAAISGFVATVGLVPIAIAAVVAALTALIFNVGGSRDAVVAFGTALISNLQSAFTTVTSAVSAFGSMLVSTFQSAFSAVSGAVSSFAGTVMSQFQSAFSSVISTVTSAASSIQGTISSMMSSLVSSIQSGASSVLSAIQGVIQQAISAIQGAVGAFTSAGSALMQGFASGIASSAGAAYSQVQNAVANVRNLLPFSPAKEGPLSDLDVSGMALFRTIADNLDIGVLKDKVSSALSTIDFQNLNLGTVAQGLGNAVNGAINYAQSNIIPQLSAPQMATATAGNTQVEYTQNIYIESKMSGSEIITALKSAQRDFLRYLSDTELVKLRKQS